MNFERGTTWIRVGSLGVYRDGYSGGAWRIQIRYHIYSPSEVGVKLLNVLTIVVVTVVAARLFWRWLS
jgi:hypothetical protein